MEDKDIEKKLKSHADKVVIKNFSERWDSIQARKDITGSNDLIQEPVAINDSGQTTVFRNYKKLLVIISSVFLLCVIIFLSIVLPIVLQKNDEIRYFEVDELWADATSDFDYYYDNLANANIEVISFDESEVETYILYYTRDNILVGGGVELINENIGYIAHVNFYNNLVAVRDNLVDYEEYHVKDVTIKFNINYKNDRYTTTAIAQYNKLTYVIDCTSISDEVLELFDNLFS